MNNSNRNNMRINTVVQYIKYVYNFLEHSKHGSMYIKQIKNALNAWYKDETLQYAEVDYICRFFGIRKQSVIRDVEAIKERFNGLIKYLGNIEKLKNKSDCLKTMREMYKYGSFSRTTYDLLRELIIKGESDRFVDDISAKKRKNVSDLIDDFRKENGLDGLRTDRMLRDYNICNRLITYIVRNASKNGIKFEFTGACDGDPRDVIPLNNEDKQYSSIIMAYITMRYIDSYFKKDANSLAIIGGCTAFLGKALSKREKAEGKSEIDSEFFSLCTNLIISDVELKQGKIIRELDILYQHDDFKELYENLRDNELSRYIQIGIVYKKKFISSEERTRLARNKAKALAYMLEVIDIIIYRRNMIRG